MMGSRRGSHLLCRGKRSEQMLESLDEQPLVAESVISSDNSPPVKKL